MSIHCNAGVTSTNLIGELPGYGTVWYHPKGIANTLSLTRVQERRYIVPFDICNNYCCCVTKTDGSVHVFEQSNCGLYFMLTNREDMALVNTVNNNMSRYNNCNQSQAILARKIQNLIGQPSTCQYKDIIDSNLPNCQVSQKDINAAEDILGPNIGNLKGKTVWKPVPYALTMLINIPGDGAKCTLVGSGTRGVDVATLSGGAVSSMEELVG
jgi:hypothetical protein